MIFVKVLFSLISLSYPCIAIGKNNKYYDLILAADRTYFPLASLMVPGFVIAAKLKNNFLLSNRLIKNSNPVALKQMKKDFFAFCLTANIITSLWIFIPAGFYVYILSRKALLSVVILISGFLVGLYPLAELKKRDGETEKQILYELPDVSLKLSLLLSAGLVLREAIKQTAYSSDGILYDELKNAVRMTELGMSDREALEKTAECSQNKEIRHFVSIIVQNISKGGTELPLCLKRLSGENWIKRKNAAKIMGHKAEQKLMIPLIMMFIGILILIVAPLLSDIV